MKRIAATAALVLVVACGGRPSTLTSPSGGEPPILAIPAYDRDEWPTWVDADGGQDTRAEVLIAESLTPVAFAEARQCRVVSGRWHDPYTGLEYMNAARGGAHRWRVDVGSVV